MLLRNVLSILVFASMSSTAFAAETNIVCTLKSLSDKQSAKASLPLSSVDKDGISSDGTIDIGDFNYSFSLDLMSGDEEIQVNVVFYENNRVTDEVGSFSCIYDESVKGKFCEEPMEDFDGNHVMDFACEAK